MTGPSPFKSPPSTRLKKLTRERTSDGSRTRGGGRVGRAGRPPAFTVSEAAEIRKRLLRFENPHELAKEYGVDKSTILAAGKRDYVGRADEVAS